MRPGLRAPRGVPFDNYGSHPPRGYPRFGPPRFPISEDLDDHDPSGDNGPLGHCNDLPGNFQNMSQMRMRGPPPFMGKSIPSEHPGMQGAMPPISGAQSFNGPPFNAPPNGVNQPGPPFSGPPGHMNGPFGGPPFGAPPFTSRPFPGPFNPPGPVQNQAFNGLPTAPVDNCQSTPALENNAPGPVAPPLNGSNTVPPSGIAQPPFSYSGFTSPVSEGNY